LIKKNLADWIVEERKKGHSDAKIYNFLVEEGEKPKKINKAFDIVNQISHKPSFTPKELFKPTILKLFIPAIILILILISFFVNTAHANDVSRLFCELPEKQEPFMKFVTENRNGTYAPNIDPQTVITFIEETDILVEEMLVHYSEISNHFKPLIIGNIHIYVLSIYKFNPLYPIPCEYTGDPLPYGKTDRFCRFYISEENYECIKEFMNEGVTGSSILGSPEMPVYKNISFFGLMFHTLILMFIVYGLTCLLVFANKIISEEPKKIINIINVFIVGALVLFITLVDVHDELFFTLFLFLLIIFIFFSYFRKDTTRKRIAKIFLILFILVIIVGFIIATVVANKNFTRSEERLNNIIEYSVVDCPESKYSKITEETVEDLRLPTEYDYNGTYRCPLCYEVCDDYCESYYDISTEVYGDKPSCICRCEK